MKPGDQAAQLNALANRVTSLSAAYTLAVHIPVQVLDVSGTDIPVTTTQYQPVRILRRNIVVDIVPPAVPTWPTTVFSNVTPTSMTINWNANTEVDFKSYQLYRRTGAAAFALVATIARGTTFYNDSGLTQSTTYDYQLRALDNASNASAFTATRSQATTTASVTLSWTNNPALSDPVQVPRGGFYDFTNLITGISQLGSITHSGPALPTGVTLSSAAPWGLTGAGGATLTGGVTGHQFTLVPAAAADWTNRISAAGVLWATTFDTVADVNKWPGHGDPPSVSYLQFQANRGVIPGKGCLRQQLPAGGIPGTGTDGRTGWIWGRPIQPIAGDINQPGLPTLAANPNFVSLWNNGGTGYIMNNAYAGGAFTQVANEFYLQFRIRFSPNRFSQGGGLNYSKFMLIENHSQNVNQELSIDSGRNFNQNVPNMYTNKGSGQFNSCLEGNQNGDGSSGQTNNPTSNGKHLPGSDYIIPSGPFAGQSAGQVCTVANGENSAFVWPVDEWVTVLIHFKPGTKGDRTQTPQSAANIPHQNTVAEMKIARAGATTYTTMYSESYWVWDYDETATDALGHAIGPGVEWINMNYFTGGSGWITPNVGWYHEFDQVICSISPIACPLV